MSRRHTQSSLLVPILLGLAACTSRPPVADCPGTVVATFTFAATRLPDAAGCAEVLGPPAYTGPAPDFVALYPLELPAANGAATLTVAYASQGQAAALCTDRPGATPFTGTRAPATADDDQVTATLETSGAVLAACSGLCAVTVRQEISGLLRRDPASGAVTGFTGTLTETDTATAGADCTPCVAPCGATYTLDLTPVTP